MTNVANIRRAVEIDLADGRVLTFSPDNDDPALIPVSTSFDTEMPGGFGPATIIIPRGELSQQTLGLFSGTRIYEADTDRTFHEGRIASVATSGSQITIGVEGWAKHLEDDNTRKYLFVDRDLTKWSGPSVQRKINVAGSNFAITDGGVAVNDTTSLQPALDLTFLNKWTAASLPDVEAWYDAGPGMSIGSIYYAWKQLHALTSDAGTAWAVHLSTDDVASSYDYSGNLRATGPGSGTLGATASRRFALVNHASSTAPTGFTGTLDGYECSVFFTVLAVFGDHGLPKQGTGSFVDAPGLLGSDCMSVILRDAPLLNFTTGPYGSVPPTAFSIPHLVFDSPTTPLEALSAVNIFGGPTNELNDWGVYEKRTFFCRAPGTYGRTWRVRRDQATESSDSGPDAEKVLNGVVVTFDDGTGVQKSVGPPGAQADTTSTLLQSTDPTNPANNDGARHWEVWDAGITSQDGALLIGRLILAFANSQQWRGDVTMRDTVRDSTGALFPVEMVRAGDYVVVEDDYDTTPRKIVGTSMGERTLSVSVGADPNTLDVLLSRLGVSLIGKL